MAKYPLSHPIKNNIMITLYYILRSFFNCWHWHTSYRSSLPYLGLSYYFSYKGRDKKPFLRVLYELEQLSLYWRCFNDVYFEMSMFLNTWTDLDKMKSFVPQDAYFRMEKHLDRTYNILLDDKVIFHDLMNYYHIPVPHVYFIFKDGHFLTPNQAQELDDATIDALLQEVAEPRLFVKRNVGGEATGVDIFSRRADGTLLHHLTPVSASYIRQQFQGSHLFFERQIHQPNYIRELNPDTVNTIRVLAARHHDEVVIYSATLRVGRQGNYVDNAARGGLTIAINTTDGSFANHGLRMYDPQQYSTHPDTGHAFAGRRILEWDAVVALVQKTLRALPLRHSLGFDIAITDDGPVIVEINTGAGMFLSQAGRPRGLGKEFVRQQQQL